MSTLVHRAAAMIRYYAMTTDPDKRTSMADARIALCVARGVALDDIDPASGYDCSKAAYDESRRSWVLHIKEWGLSDIYDRPHLDRAIANWVRRRPHFIDGDDWLTAATAAHYAYWDDLGRACPRETCDLHEQGAEVEGDQGVQGSLFADPAPTPAAASIPLPRRRSITDLQLPA